jgi:hypothetical protein
VLPSLIAGGLVVALMFSLTHLGGTPRGLVCAGLVLADRDSDATFAAPEKLSS